MTEVPAVGRTDASHRGSGRVRVTGVLAFAVMSMAVMQTSSIALLPELPGVFDTSIAAVSWVATSTLVAGAVANPIVGRMGDLYGKRRMILWCLACAAAGSLLGAAAGSLLVVVIGRTLQGLGSGVIPLAFGIVRDDVPERGRSRAVSVITATGAGLGAGLGPVVMGAVLTAFGWRAVFWLTLLATVSSMVAISRTTMGGVVGARTSFDWQGAVLLSTTLVTALVGITNGADWGWSSPRVVGCIAVAVALAVVWIRWERSRASPLVDLALSGAGKVLIAHLGGFMVGFSIFAQYIITFTLVALPAETGYGLGRTAAVAGLVQLPGAVALGSASLAAPRFSDARGARRLVEAAALVVLVGFILGLNWHGSVLQLVLSVMVVNLGLGAAFCALPILIIENVSAEQVAAANAINALSRVVGSVTASAVVPAILSTGSFLGGHPEEWAFEAAYVLAGLVVVGFGLSARLIARDGK